MYRPHYETQATIKLHQHDLLHQAERDRLLAAAGMRSMSLKRALAAAGGWLVAVGTRLESRYADAPAPVSLAAARKSST